MHLILWISQGKVSLIYTNNAVVVVVVVILLLILLLFLLLSSLLLWFACWFGTWAKRQNKQKSAAAFRVTLIASCKNNFETNFIYVWERGRGGDLTENRTGFGYRCDNPTHIDREVPPNLERFFFFFFFLRFTQHIWFLFLFLFHSHFGFCKTLAL